MRAKVKKVDEAQLQFVSIRQNVTERICHGNGDILIWAIPESVTYTVETDGEWSYDNSQKS